MTVKSIQKDSGAIVSFVKKPAPGMVVKVGANFLRKKNLYKKIE
jgi:hypothetical protein